jgi:hypothetical protein
MDANGLLPRPWFSADDTREPVRVRTLPGDPLRFREMNKEERPVLKFINQEKFLILNKTHRDIMIEAYGSETNEWGDKEIELFSEAQSRSITLRPLTRADPLEEDQGKEERIESAIAREEAKTGGTPR